MSPLGLNNASESISFLDALTPGSCNILAKCGSGLRIVCCLPVFSPRSLFSDGPTTNPDAETEPRCQPFTPAPRSSSPCGPPPPPCLTDFWLCLVLFSVHSSDSNRDLTYLLVISLSAPPGPSLVPGSLSNIHPDHRCLLHTSAAGLQPLSAQLTRFPVRLHGYKYQKLTLQRIEMALSYTHTQKKNQRSNLVTPSGSQFLSSPKVLI